MVIARIACGPIHAPNFGFSIYPDGARDQLVKKCVFLHKSKVSPPLSDADMRLVKRNLDKLSDFDQTLFRFLAATGMRLSEAFEIDGEMKERGVRYVIVGKKTEQSLRRVPLPACVLPYLPKVIKGRLFVTEHLDPPDMASKRLGKFLDDIGITDPRKVVHSLRHRAQDRLRAAECPEDIRWAILGHQERTVAAGYGEGFSLPVLRKWVDKIGV